jgi:hypothetical protein
LQTSAPENAIAAFDLPDPAGPVKSQVFVITWFSSLALFAEATASFKIATTCN